MIVYAYEGGPGTIEDRSGNEYRGRDGVNTSGATFTVKIDAAGRRVFDLPPLLFHRLISNRQDSESWRRANPAACSELAKISLPIL